MLSPTMSANDVSANAEMMPGTSCRNDAMFATHVRRHIMCEAHIITVGNIICPSGQTSLI